jgi:hypothetical protein
MIRPKAWQSKNGPVRFTASNRRHCSAAVSSAGVMSEIPAFVDEDVDAAEPLTHLLGEPRHVLLH